MKKHVSVWVVAVVVVLLLSAAGGCGGSSAPSVSGRAANTEAGGTPGGGFSTEGGDPLPELWLPSANEIGEPQQDPNPPGLLQGDFVVFYTWQSDGSFVTKEEFEAFSGLEPSWDPNILPLNEFRAQYGPEIPLTPRAVYSGFTVYDPYHLSVDELNIDDDLRWLIEPGMTEEEAFEAIQNYVRSAGQGKAPASLRGMSYISTPNPPEHDIHLDVDDWLVSRFDPIPWWIYFTGTIYNHAALVFWPGCAHTATTTPRHYYFAGYGTHPDWRYGGQYGWGVDLWDATVMEAIGPLHMPWNQVGHYWYSRGFIDPGSRLAEISYNFSPYVWADANWVSIINGVTQYAYQQDTRVWDFPESKWNFFRPLIPYTKGTYCSHLIWQSYYISTLYNASDWRITPLRIDRNHGYNVYPEDLMYVRYTREYDYWARPYS